MDDYSINTLVESKNEWCARLVNICTPCIMEGLKTIFSESLKLCLDNDEEEKYLMTFQNFLSRIPKWNSDIINNEKQRIIQKSGCSYIEDLITCVHIVQLKALTCTRVGTKQKKIDINIPSLNDFIHKIYINVARKLYTNIYLFEKDILPLEIQKNNRELEIIIKEAILNTIRENIPIEHLLRAYLDETEEMDIKVEEREEIIPLKNDNSKDLSDNSKINNTEKIVDENKESSKQDLDLDTQIETKSNIKLDTNNEDKELTLIDENKDSKESESTNLKFSDIDIAVSTEGTTEPIVAPKDIETLEQISKINNEKRKEEEALDNDEETLVIGEDINIDIGGIKDLSINPKPSNEIILKDIEVL